jgi:two-component sensor histidine kinase
LSLGLALHELTTNAIKHGALKNGEGRVIITVSADDETVHLRWRETGLGKISPPDATRTGFGSFLLNRVLESELGGETNAVFNDDGLTYDIRFPAARRAVSES